MRFLPWLVGLVTAVVVGVILALLPLHLPTAIYELIGGAAAIAGALATMWQLERSERHLE